MSTSIIRRLHTVEKAMGVKHATAVDDVLRRLTDQELEWLLAELEALTAAGVSIEGPVWIVPPGGQDRLDHFIDQYRQIESEARSRPETAIATSASGLAPAAASLAGAVFVLPDNGRDGRRP